MILRKKLILHDKNKGNEYGSRKIYWEGDHPHSNREHGWNLETYEEYINVWKLNILTGIKEQRKLDKKECQEGKL